MELAVLGSDLMALLTFLIRMCFQSRVCDPGLHTHALCVLTVPCVPKEHARGVQLILEDI